MNPLIIITFNTPIWQPHQSTINKNTQVDLCNTVKRLKTTQYSRLKANSSVTKEPIFTACRYAMALYVALGANVHAASPCCDDPLYPFHHTSNLGMQRVVTWHETSP